MDTTYVSEYSTETTKYTGPFAIVKYDGLKNSENQMEGEAQVLFANGSTYFGHFHKDMMHGKGVLTSSDGSQQYEGDWFEDKRHGLAKFVYEGGVYTGFYKDNKRHGKGKEVDSVGNEFDGEYVDGEAVNGIMNYENGDIYVGEWKNDSREGRGKFISIETGKTFDGLWKDDDFLG